METPSQTYLPEYNDNREEDEPFSVELTPLSSGDIQGYGDQIQVKPMKGFRNKTTSNVAKVQKKQFCDNIGEIKGLNDPLSGMPITNATQLYETPGMFPLVKELIGAMEDVSILSDGLEKNFASQSSTP